MKWMLFACFLLGKTTFLMADGRIDAFIDMALSQNSALLVQQSRINSSRLKSEQMGVMPDPKVAYTHFVNPIQTRLGPQEHIFSLTQEIPFPGTLGLIKKQSIYEAEVTEISKATIERHIILKMRTFWSNLYLYDATIRVLNGYINELKRLEKLSNSAYETGRITYETILDIKMELAEIELQLLQLSTQRKNSQAELNKAMGRSLEYSIEAVDSLSALKSKTPGFLQLSYENRPELKIADVMIQTAQTRHDLAHKRGWPSFALSANYFMIGKSDMAVASNGKDAFSFMVGMNIPIYRNQLSKQKKHAVSDIALWQRQKEDSRQKIELEQQLLQQKWDEINEKQKLFKNTLLPIVEKNIQQALTRYKNGEVGYKAVVIAYKKQLKFKKEYIQLLQTRYKTQAGMEHAVAERWK